MNERLKVCPFCGSTNLQVAKLTEIYPRLEISNNNDNVIQIWCKGCGALGPEELDTECAVISWNSRVDVSGDD